MAMVLPRGRWLLLVLSVKWGSGEQMVGVSFLSLLFLAVCVWNCEILRCQGWGISSSCPLCLALESVYEKEKRCTSGSCKLNFTWGKMRSAVWETAHQIALRDCSKEAAGKVNICDFGEGEGHITKHLFHTRSSAGHEELMSAWRDLVLF